MSHASHLIHFARADLSKLAADLYVVPTRHLAESKGVAWQVIHALLCRYTPDRVADTIAMMRDELRHGSVHREFVQVLQTQIPRNGGAPIQIVCLDSVSATSVEESERRARLALKLALEALPRADSSNAAPRVIATAGFRVGSQKDVGAAFANVLHQAWMELSGDFVKRNAELHVALWKESSYVACIERFAPVGEEPAGVFHDIAEALRHRRGFLFVGSGLSFNAQPPKPTWAQLFPAASDPLWPEKLAPLAEELSANKSLLPEVAQVLEDHQPNGLRSYVGEQVRGYSLPALSHYQLLTLPWNVIVTTNYDTLIEDTLAG